MVGRQMNLMKVVGAASFTALMLSGCAVTTQGMAPTVYDPAIRSEVEGRLAESSARAANALETLAMIQRARTAPAPSTIDESQLPEELTRRTTLNWSGPAPSLVEELAKRAGYAFAESGNRPATPALVNMDLRDTSLARALEDVGLQVQATATVIVDPNARRIEYRNEAVKAAEVLAPPSGKRAGRAPSLRSEVRK